MLISAITPVRIMAHLAIRTVDFTDVPTAYRAFHCTAHTDHMAGQPIGARTLTVMTPIPTDIAKLI
jgi:hypothetical protein